MLVFINYFKDTKVLNMYNNCNLQKRHCQWIVCT